MPKRKSGGSPGQIADSDAGSFVMFASTKQHCCASALAYKHEAADGFTFEEVQEFQSVLEAADLAFSLDPDIVTLKDSVYQVVMNGAIRCTSSHDRQGH